MLNYRQGTLREKPTLKMSLEPLALAEIGVRPDQCTLAILRSPPTEWTVRSGGHSIAAVTSEGVTKEMAGRSRKLEPVFGCNPKLDRHRVELVCGGYLGRRYCRTKIGAMR